MATHLPSAGLAGATPNYPDQAVGPALNPGVGAVNVSTTTVTGSTTAVYNAQASDQVIFVDTGSVNVTINLPPISNAGPGKRILVIKRDSGSGSVTVVPNGSDTIEGAANRVISSQNGKVGVINDAVSTWFDLGTGGV